jgi:NAD(P)-dependent dehydrogenase (short-subunit alcohol dehydrogenase family)
MAKTGSMDNPSDRKAFIITGPTSGIGRCTALELAQHSTVVLVGRDRKKLDEMQKTIEQKGQHAVSVVCDLSDLASVRRAAAEIVAFDLPIAGLLNNAGIMQMRATKNALGWDMTFATNHLGPFALTEALVPHLPDGADVVFVASAVEDPERKPAKAVGFRGARYISAQASARGEWQPDGSKMPGADAYATSKQCNLATAMVFARETPRLHFNAVEPGVNLTTGLGQRDANAFVGFLSKYIIPALVPLLMPFMKFLSTPTRAARRARAHQSPAQ